MKLLQKIMSVLATKQSKLVGGLGLLCSFVFIKLLKYELYFDPAWITIVCCGIPILYGSLRRLILMKQIKAGLLISIAMIASIIRGHLFAAGEVVFLMAMGGLLEDFSIARTQKGLSNLIKLVPTIARRLINGVEEECSVEALQIGDTLRVLPGEAFPADGVVRSGTTTVNQAIMTGESLPVDKGVGDSVFCGTINCYGVVDIEVSKEPKDSSLQKLIQLVREAESKKAPMQGLADKWASWLVPAALLIAIAVGFVTKDLDKAVTILVVFCPCSLALATPISIVAAIGQGTRKGVLIKSGAALEAMAHVDVMAFDKTGTLTNGSLVVSDIYPTAGNNEEELVSVSSAVEAYSEHPIAKAICTKGKEFASQRYSIENFKMTPGGGVEAMVDGCKVCCGTVKFVLSDGNTLPQEVAEKFDNFSEQGKATLVVTRAGEIIGVIALADTIREESAQSIASLTSMGIKPILLTGDNVKAAQYAANTIGLAEVYAQQLPENKVQRIMDLQADKHIVAMVGDGVNDAPSIKIANVGVAMGSFGSDIAIDAADIALMGDRLSLVVYLRRLAKATIRTIRTNIIISMTVNVIAIICSIYGLLNPVTGALVHNVSSLLVVVNAALLYDRDS